MQNVTLWAAAHAVALAQLLWGTGYGLGAGLGLAFYLCQAQAHVLLREGE